ncbi:SLAM family member 5 isoform X3 [Tursiops truncatus]|uniref:SLAM family member 5 isoform X3 n=1 Tax=Tursiops truncatus TaxID=9739 RepID=A0A2U4B4S7_TURTR|nr:SLAM family member 5 isoform X3 [Tursiops truncatus]XP_030697894.1 SLAM family member 5 isoform X3 [Globicephala melas]
MALHHLWILLLCLQTCLEAAGSDTDIFMVNGILGELVTFPLNIQQSQKVISISWNSKTSVAFVTPGNSGAAPTISITHQNYHKRINVSGQNYNLELRNLRLEDSGIYKADINVMTSEMITTTTRCYNLQVYRRLGKPKITQSLMTSVNRTCNVTLTCSVEKEEKNVTYSWSPLGEEGNVLRVFQTPDNQELTYTCTAWNPVSNNSDSISAQQLCADIAMGLHTHRTGLLSGLAVLSLLLIILPSVILFLLHKRGQGSYLKIFSKNPDAASKKTIYTYVTVPRDTQTAELRIYDEIPQSKMGVLHVLPTKEKPVNAIYSIVQYSDKMGKTNTQDSKPPGTSSYEIVI